MPNYLIYFLPLWDIFWLLILYFHSLSSINILPILLLSLKTLFFTLLCQQLLHWNFLFFLDVITLPDFLQFRAILIFSLQHSWRSERIVFWNDWPSSFILLICLNEFSFFFFSQEKILVFFEFFDWVVLLLGAEVFSSIPDLALRPIGKIYIFVFRDIFFFMKSQ